MPHVTAVISTFERPSACERALISALEQRPAPVEFLVCDDGSADDTAERFRAWQIRDPRIRYLRTEPNRGTPGVTRNLGTRAALGDWVAYLDDDDVWLPGKLQRQGELTARAQVIGTNAIRTDGSPYFGEVTGVSWPGPSQLVADNPLIVSTVLARRQLVIDAGGFLTDRWARGVADYAMWLGLADRGARLARIGEPLARYESHSSDRMSAAPIRQELALSRLAWRRVAAMPGDRLARRAALNRTAGTLSTAWNAARRAHAKPA